MNQSWTIRKKSSAKSGCYKHLKKDTSANLCVMSVKYKKEKKEEEEYLEMLT